MHAHTARCPECDEPDDAYHRLFRCGQFAEQRKVLMNEILNEQSAADERRKRKSRRKRKQTNGVRLRWDCLASLQAHPVPVLNFIAACRRPEKGWW